MSLYLETLILTFKTWTTSGKKTSLVLPWKYTQKKMFYNLSIFSHSICIIIIIDFFSNSYTLKLYFQKLVGDEKYYKFYQPFFPSGKFSSWFMTKQSIILFSYWLSCTNLQRQFFGLLLKSACMKPLWQCQSNFLISFFKFLLHNIYHTLLNINIYSKF